VKIPRFPLPPGAPAVSGLSGSSKALFLVSLGKPFMVVSKSEEEASKLHADMEFFARALGVQAPVFLPAGDAGVSAARLRAVEAIVERGASMVVTYPDAVKVPVWSGEAFKKASVTVKTGDDIGLEFLADLLSETGYRRMSIVVETAEYALRGGIIDVYPAAGDHPCRIEFFGDEVESIRAFDVDTQRSFKDIDELVIYPAAEPARPAGGITLFEALPDHMVISDEAAAPDLPRRDLSTAALRIQGEGAFYDILPVDGFGVTALERRVTGADIDVIGPKLAEAARDAFVLVAAGSRGEADRVRDLLGEAGVIAPVIEPGAVAGYAGRIAVTQARISSGFYEPSSRFLLITTEELFGPRAHYRKRRQSKVSNLLQSIDDLASGDYIIHVDHGVGRFLGMRRIKVEDFEGDFLDIEYSEGAKLHLPVDNIGKIRKYHAADDTRPALDRLGGKGWEKTKARVRKKVREMADKLIKIYAEREAAEGFAFSPDTDFHREFAAAFPFDETPDQTASIHDIAHDMESRHPMDRLLCGDVGYGKTEVAMRAAFKAAFDGRQTAVLVPTTILAEQHYDNFVSRFSAFPVRIDYLSRFKPRDAQKETLRRLAAGEIDILIGTHALLAKTVAFNDLGLLIVDEEHKFGVAHKERIKALKKNIDVLTLSATPIPRTLHMAISGIRGISTIETPPEERLAVKTIVTRSTPEVIREALDREFSRGGQAFFLHNRIETIYKTGEMLTGLMPGRRIGVAHGRMNERELEDSMHSFFRGETDLLLCTSIIGSGLDVPNANTIIVDRADRFGLADLYQLKGRVGRSDVRAFAYFLVPPDDLLTDEAKKRLAAMQELSFLGAGFRLALKDMEIRGAGNLLGGEQSGHIDAVGYDLYVEMLEQAVSELRGEEIRAVVDPVLELQLNAIVPETWIDDSTLRFTLYRRVSGARDVAALDDIRKETRDRFGAPPDEVTHLLDAMELKLLCRAAGVSKIRRAGKVCAVMFANPSDAAANRLISLAGRTAGMRFLPQGGVELRTESGWDGAFRRLKEFLGAVGG